MSKTTKDVEALVFPIRYKDLEDAEKILFGALHAFERHHRNLLNTRLELAKVFHLRSLLLKDEASIGKGVDQIKLVLEGKPKPQQAFEAKVLDLRFKLVAAKMSPADLVLSADLDAAVKAVEPATKNKDFSTVSGLVAIVEVNLFLASSLEDVRLDVAEKCPQQAGEQGKGNPLTLAVATLQMALVAAKRQQFKRANDLIEKWNSEYKAIVEDGFVLYLATEVENRLREATPFSGLEGRKEKNYYDIEKDLRRWLLDKASEELKEAFHARAHEFLGISRATAFNWELQYDRPRTRGAK